MRKRYQVFVGATATDLEQVRRAVSRALMEMDGCPVMAERPRDRGGSDAAFARRLIENCDYHLLIFGGCYGLITEAEVALFESEFDHAVSKGIRVVSLIHGERGVAPRGIKEIVGTMRGRLEAFRAKAARAPLVRYWGDVNELSGLAVGTLFTDMAERRRASAPVPPSVVAGATSELPSPPIVQSPPAAGDEARAQGTVKSRNVGMGTRKRDPAEFARMKIEIDNTGRMIDKIKGDISEIKARHVVFSVFSIILLIVVVALMRRGHSVEAYTMGVVDVILTLGWWGGFHKARALEAERDGLVRARIKLREEPGE